MQVQSNFHISTFTHSFVLYKWHKPDVFAAERANSYLDAHIKRQKASSPVTVITTIGQRVDSWIE